MTAIKSDTPGFDRKSHWEDVYSNKLSTEVSWYQQHPEYSLAHITATGLKKSARIIDIGGGASTLIDYLLDAEYTELSVLDISSAAIEQARARLGNRADDVVWYEQDVTEFSPERPFDVWHDRAVFHFLTDPIERSSYVHVLTRALKPGAFAMIATFDLHGPKQCSGLDVQRYSQDTMSAALGDSFELIDTTTEVHVTPNGSMQNFVYCRFVRIVQ